MNDMLAAMRARRAGVASTPARTTDAGAQAAVFPVRVPVVPAVAQDREQPQSRMDSGLFPVFPLFPLAADNMTGNADAADRVQPMTGDELRLIGAVLDADGITDAAQCWRVLDDAQTDAAARAWWIGQVGEPERWQAERDERRICAECAHYRGGQCANWRAAGYVRPVRVAAGGPLARCAGYAPRLQGNREGW